ncbi:MAG: FlgD immunoglobulin-like domain containing protein [candidate division WOR-3 bacterium]
MRPTRILTMLLAVAVTAVLAQVETLPAPVVNHHSFELLSNSRYSVHSGFTSSLPTQVLANILWAMARAPALGSFREIYVATPSNVYLYDHQSHTLSVHLSGNHRYSSSSAFEIGIACERDEEAGMAIQAGLLAATAFWDSASGSVASCPMQFATNYANSNWQPNNYIRMVNVHGRRTGTGLNRTLQAVSSDSSLPLPRVTGPDTFEILLAGLEQDSLFSPCNLTLEEVSQLLWAGFGVTPHTTSNGRRGTTIPSAIANYYLTRRIYLVRDVGVHRYHNRLPPGTGLTTSDHRIELVTAGDRRDQLRAACPRLPSSAPVYIVITVGDTTSNYNRLEAAFAAFQYLMQANQLGLKGHLTAPLTPAERAAIISALGIPSTDLPLIVFSTGHPCTGVFEQSELFQRPPTIRIVGQRPPVTIELKAGRHQPSRLVVLDLAGRPVRTFTLSKTEDGQHHLLWDGTDLSGNTVPAGIYLVRLELTDSREPLIAHLTLIR